MHSNFPGLVASELHSGPLKILLFRLSSTGIHGQQMVKNQSLSSLSIIILEQFKMVLTLLNLFLLEFF
jgi:hypothetical protein